MAATATAVAVGTGRLRRVIETTSVVAIWIVLGIVLHLSVRAYLLVGIPLTAGFQWGVRRQPLRALWLRDAVPLRLDITGWTIAVLLAIAPTYQLVIDVHQKTPKVNVLFDLAAVAGAVAAAYSVRNLRRVDLRPFLLCLVTGRHDWHPDHGRFRLRRWVCSPEPWAAACHRNWFVSRDGANFVRCRRGVVPRRF